MSQLHEIYTAAISRISGQAGEPRSDDFQKACRELETIARDFPPAAAVLASLGASGCSQDVNDERAAGYFLAAAKSGYSPAIRGLAVMLIREGTHADMGIGLLRHAAQAGDWIAAFLILRQAIRGEVYANANTLKQLAAKLSPAVPFRDDIMASVNTIPGEVNPIPFARFASEPCQDVIRSNLHELKSSSGEELFDHPRIKSFNGALSALDCDYLIALSAGLMVSSKVVDAEKAGAVTQNYRTSDGAVLLPAQVDLVAVCLLRQLSHVAGINPGNGEFLSLLRYRPGQEYRPHHDYLEPDANDYSRVTSCGQRHSTLLTYLNTGYGGGATEFPKIGIRFKGEVGDALLFQNTDTSGTPIPSSLHAGMPVESGEKWLATLWCREKPFWPWVRR